MNSQEQKNDRQAVRLALAMTLVLVSVMALVGVSAAQNAPVKPSITVSQLAGRWQITAVGNTGCGISSILFTGTLNSSGTATGTLKGNNGCGASSSTQTFNIISLNANGSGTAGLTCGTGCGWTFNIQVSPNLQVFNLVDITDPSNYLAGTAVK
jgi:hypothetical protein